MILAINPWILTGIILVGVFFLCMLLGFIGDKIISKKENAVENISQEKKDVEVVSEEKSNNNETNEKILESNPIKDAPNNGLSDFSNETNISTSNNDSGNADIKKTFDNNNMGQINNNVPPVFEGQAQNTQRAQQPVAFDGNIQTDENINNMF